MNRKSKSEYRTKEYFDENTTYVFDNGYRMFESKVELYRGFWYTVENMNYKAMSLPCYKK